MNLISHHIDPAIIIIFRQGGFSMLPPPLCVAREFSDRFRTQLMAETDEE